MLNVEIIEPQVLRDLEALNGGNGMALFYQPFSVETKEGPELLESLKERIVNQPIVWEDLKKTEAVIEERKGVHYINRNLLNADEPVNTITLDQDFKHLIDSIFLKDT